MTGWKHIDSDGGLHGSPPLVGSAGKRCNVLDVRLAARPGLFLLCVVLERPILEVAD